MLYLNNKDIVTGFPPYSYQAALQAKKERTSKAAASFGPKSRYQTNLKEVCKHNIDYTLCIYIYTVISTLYIYTRRILSQNAATNFFRFREMFGCGLI